MWKDWICIACKKALPYIPTFTMHGFDALPCLVQVSPSASTPCVSFWLRLHAECCLCEHERMKRSCWKRNKLCVIDWPRFCYFHDSSSFWGVALEQHSLTVFPMSLIHDMGSQTSRSSLPRKRKQNNCKWQTHNHLRTHSAFRINHLTCLRDDAQRPERGNCAAGRVRK